MVCIHGSTPALSTYKPDYLYLKPPTHKHGSSAHPEKLGAPVWSSQLLPQKLTKYNIGDNKYINFLFHSKHNMGESDFITKFFLMQMSIAALYIFPHISEHVLIYRLW